VVRPAALDRVAGLDGFIREWSVQAADAQPNGWTAAPIRNDFGLWLRQDARLAALRGRRMRLRARLIAPRHREVTLVLNMFAGFRLSLNGQRLAAPAPQPWYDLVGLRHRLDLPAGESELLVEVTPEAGPPVFAARLLDAPDVSVRPVEQGAPDAEAFRYYQARTSAPPARDAWADGAAFAAWRGAFRASLARLLPGPAGPDGPLPGAAPWAAPPAELLRREVLPDHVRETVRLTVEPGWQTDVYVLVPRPGPRTGGGPWPALLCLHGHAYGKDDLVGLDGGDPARRDMIDRLREDYALRYVRRGFVTATLGMRLLADRGWPRGAWQRRDPCDHGYALATMCGLVPAALDASDARRVLGLLAARPEVAADARGPLLGCVGLSYGGRATMYVTALDQRVRAAVVSGALNTFRERLVSYASCGSQWVPGLFAIGDTPEVLASIAPRPLLFELGSVDGTSPAIFAEDIARTLERAYDLAGARERLAFDIFDGGHRYSGRIADAWLDRCLTRDAAGAG
jgi:hypothetical protein